MNRKGAPLVENIQIFCGRNSMKFFVELIRDFSVGIETKEKSVGRNSHEKISRAGRWPHNSVELKKKGIESKQKKRIFFSEGRGFVCLHKRKELREK